MAAAGDSVSPEALPGLFGRAADHLAERHSVDAPDAVGVLLRTLGYAPPDPGADGVRTNRIALLRAASRFARVFQLGAPDAPGLAFLGGEVAPGIVGPRHAEAPLVGVGGMGLSLGAAFASCVGEGVEFLSQFEVGDEPLLTSSVEELLQGARGEARTFLENLLRAADVKAGTALQCLRADGLGNDGTMLLPAEICLRRAPGRARFTPPFLLGTGCGAGRTKADAVLHGLCELVERDAAALWWRGGVRGRPLALEDPALGEAATLLGELRQGRTSRRTWLLDITTDLGVPAAAAVSVRSDGKAFAFGLGARPNMAGAARGALMELCQLELGQAVVAAKRAESGEARLNAPDRAHIARATQIDAQTCLLLHPAGIPARHDICPADDAEAQAAWIARRLATLGIEAFVVDLTRPAFGVPVVRVVAPGLQLEPSGLDSARLQRAIAATGGGAQLTGDVALF